MNVTICPLHGSGGVSDIYISYYWSRSPPASSTRSPVALYTLGGSGMREASERVKAEILADCTGSPCVPSQ